MISEKMAARLNEQVKNEFYAEWAYLAMAYSFEDMGLKVFAARFFQQATEEREHAMKVAKYLVEQGAAVKLQQLPQPKIDYKSAEEIVAAALEHEKKVTRDFNEIADLAISERDHATGAFCKWFIDEQVEEVSSMSELLTWVKMASSPGQLLMLENRIYAQMSK